MNDTQTRVLRLLREHGSLTPRSFRHPTIDGGEEMDRLAARINELRELGHNIITVMETSPAGKRYARYVLRGEVEEEQSEHDPPSVLAPGGPHGPGDPAAPPAHRLFEVPVRHPDFDDMVPPTRRDAA